MNLEMNKIIRIMLLIAALWSIFVSSRILLTPVNIISQTAIAIQPSAGSEANDQVETTVEQQSWFQTQGWWGVIVLLIFTVLFAGVAISYSQSHLVLSGVLSLLALLLTGLAGLSIGLLYLPAALLILLGWMLRGIIRLAKARQV